MGRSRRLSSGSRPLSWSPHLYHLYDWWGEWLSVSRVFPAQTGCPSGSALISIPCPGRGAGASPQRSPLCSAQTTMASGLLLGVGDYSARPPPSSHWAPSLPRASGWWLPVPGGHVSSSSQTSLPCRLHLCPTPLLVFLHPAHTCSSRPVSPAIPQPPPSVLRTGKEMGTRGWGGGEDSPGG